MKIIKSTEISEIKNELQQLSALWAYNDKPHRRDLYTIIDQLDQLDKKLQEEA